MLSRARGSPRPRRQDVLAEAFREDCARTGWRVASETPCDDDQADLSSSQRQIRKPSGIAAMDPLGVPRATRTRTGFARVAHSYDRHRAIVDGAFNAKSRRHNHRRMKGSRHRADSFLNSTRVGAPTSSKVSLSQSSMPIDTGARSARIRAENGRRNRSLKIPGLAGYLCGLCRMNTMQRCWNSAERRAARRARGLCWSPDAQRLRRPPSCAIEMSIGDTTVHAMGGRPVCAVS